MKQTNRLCRLIPLRLLLIWMKLDWSKSIGEGLTPMRRAKDQCST